MVCSVDKDDVFATGAVFLCGGVADDGGGGIKEVRHTGHVVLMSSQVSNSVCRNM